MCRPGPIGPAPWRPTLHSKGFALVTIVGYIRVSTSDQATGGVSLDAQHNRIRAFAAARGPLDREPMIYCDEGISGKRADNRPGLADALKAACVPGGILVVYSLSRLARSVRDTLTIAERIDKAGADLVSLSESIDTTSATGKMFFRLMAVLAEFERDLLSERTKGALDHKRSQGERVGQVPYGMRLAADGVHLEPHPGEAEVLAKVVAWASCGRTVAAITRELNDREVRAKHGGRWSTRVVGRIVARATSAPLGGGMDHPQMTQMTQMDADKKNLE